MSTDAMENPGLTMAQQVARAASAFQQQITGIIPKAATAVLNEDTLVITLHGALSAAECATQNDPDGAARVQEFHRRLFASSVSILSGQINRITGVAVRGAAAEVAATGQTLVQVSTTGTLVQVFLLERKIPPDQWNAPPPPPQSR